MKTIKKKKKNNKLSDVTFYDQLCHEKRKES